MGRQGEKGNEIPVLRVATGGSSTSPAPTEFVEKVDKIEGYHFYKITFVIPTTTGENLGFDNEIKRFCCNFSQIVPVRE